MSGQICNECEAPLLKTKSGWCCPNGHGRLIPDQKKAESLLKPDEIVREVKTQSSARAKALLRKLNKKQLVDAFIEYAGLNENKLFDGGESC